MFDKIEIDNSIDEPIDDRLLNKIKNDSPE